MSVYRLTDKADSKQLPCTFPGCEHEVIVNKFYTPAKARCPEHAGKVIPSVRIAVAGEQPMESAAARPSVALGELLCPLCNQPMTVISVDEDMGWPTLRCPSPCGTVVEIKPRWGPLRGRYGLVLAGVREPMRQLLEAFNVEQMEIRARERALSSEESAIAMGG